MKEGRLVAVTEGFAARGGVRALIQFPKRHAGFSASSLGRLFGPFLFVFLFAQLLGLAFAAPAAAGSCSESYSTTNSKIILHFVASSETCTVTNANPSLSTGDFFFNLRPGGNALAFADNDLDASVENTDHQGCTIGENETKAAGVACSAAMTNSGTYTNSITAKITATKTATLTVTYAFVVSTSITINSTSFTVTDSAPASSSGSSDSTAPAALQASVSRSQTVVVATNVGARITAIGSPVGVSRSTPGGVGRDVPGGVGRTVPGGGGAGGGVGAPAPSDATNLVAATSELTADPATVSSEGLSLRQLLMRASFDTSRMAFRATPSTDGTDLPTIRTRARLPAERPLTLWGHGSYTRVDNDRNDAGGDSRYDGDVWGYNLGLDYRVREDLFAGVAVGYSETDLTTTYNSGTYAERNWSLTPYAVYQPTEALKFSVLTGYSGGDLDQNRNSASVTSDTKTAMWFVGMNASYTVRPSEDLPLDLTAKLGLLASHKVVDAYTESDGTAVDKATSNTRQILPGVEVAYTLDAGGTRFQPYANIDVVHDLKDTVNDDANAYDVGGGVRIGDAATGISGAIEAKTQLGRDDYTETTLSGMIAYGLEIENAPFGADLAQPFLSVAGGAERVSYETGLRLTGADEAFGGELTAGWSEPTAGASAPGNLDVRLKVSLRF